MKSLLWTAVLLVLFASSPAQAQVLVASDDEFAVPFGQDLLVEAFGVLDNDTLDGEAAGENGVSSELVVDTTLGTLVFLPDGSFSYTPGPDFDGIDSFTYLARFGTVTDEARVTLTACGGGPDVFDCWKETAFLDLISRHGWLTWREGFENDVIWGAVRTPDSRAWVSSQGVRWSSNHPDAPASNPVSTTSGPPHTGQWAIFDPNHGYATGTAAECDVDSVPDHCLFYDGFSGTRESGLAPLNAVGGYVSGSYGLNLAIALDGGIPIGGGKTDGLHQFFGVVDTRVAGFTHFEFRELDGKIGQALYVFGDDIVMASTQATSAPVSLDPRIQFRGASPNPFVVRTSISFTLPQDLRVRLVILDQRGRLVRTLLDGMRGPGRHSMMWDARDDIGHRVAAGVFFARLQVPDEPDLPTQARKLIVLH